MSNDHDFDNEPNENKVPSTAGEMIDKVVEKMLGSDNDEKHEDSHHDT